MGFIEPGRNNHSKIVGRKYRDGKRPPSNPYPRPPKRSSKAAAIAPLSRLESLPTELLHKIFSECHNPSLPASSRHLARTLNSPSLHLSFVRSMPPTTETLSMRFFTHEFLVTYEQRFPSSSPLDLSTAYLPVHRLLSAPWDPARVQFFTELARRGAKLDPAEREEHLSTLHDAVAASRRDAVSALVCAAGLRADAESLRLAVGMEDVVVMQMLCEAGAPAHDAGVWKSAMKVNRAGLEFVLEKGLPPGEVLGEVGSLLAGGNPGLL